MIKNLNINSPENFRLKKKNIHLLVEGLRKELEFEIEALIINFVSEQEITRLNIDYLDHHYSTDIITFNYSGSNKRLDGEIFISYDDAALNADEFKVSFQEEISRLVIHGILHLLGYDDISKKDYRMMKDEENRLLNKYKLLLLN